MENLLPDYAVWRRKYAKATVSVYFIIIIMEFVIFFVLKSNDMILQSISKYIREYFVRPIAWLSFNGIISIIISRSVISEKIKNAVPVISFTCMVGVVAIIHNVFFVTMLLFCIPISMTIVFGDKLLLRLTTVLSTLFVIGVVAYCYTHGHTSRSNAYFLPSVLISLVAIWFCSSVASTLIELLNNQNQKLFMAVEEANRANESKSAFLSNMSHEIRTPMNAIVGITDIMLRTKRDPAEERYLLNIKNSGTALLSIINDILDFSKIESGKMMVVNDNYSFYSMLDDLSLIFWNRIGDKKIELLYDIDINMPDYIYGDAIRVRQLIINIVNNAIKFTDEGFVRLSVKVGKIEGNDIELFISVADSGQGIKEEDMPKLFSSFEQVNTKKNHSKEGTGLGLAISKQLINMMGGEIGVDSEFGKGTTFSFNIHQGITDKTVMPNYDDLKQALSEKKIAVAVKDEMLEASMRQLFATLGVSVADSALDKADYDICFTEESEINHISATTKYILVNPYDDIADRDSGIIFSKPLYISNLYGAIVEAKNDADVVEEKEEQITFEGKKILLVEDNAVNTKVALLLFKPLMMEIDTAQNGQVALEMVQKKHYDLVFMDHMMPVMDGVEATLAIRKLGGDYYTNLPIIALTANVISEAKDVLLSAGMNDITTKPISMDNVIGILKKWLK
ncbi:MAG: ATP-binding protein [Agathobacter sp.]|nr:ATP-binding protein [Agathobacter sp.]